MKVGSTLHGIPLYEIVSSYGSKIQYTSTIYMMQNIFTLLKTRRGYGKSFAFDYCLIAGFINEKQFAIFP